MKERLLTIKEAMRRAQCSRYALKKAERLGMLTIHKGHYRDLVSESSLHAWMSWRVSTPAQASKPAQTGCTPAGHAMEGLCYLLPSTRKWSAAARQQWFAVMEATLDMAVRVVD